MSRFAQDYFREAAALAAAGSDFIVVTWLKSQGHAPQDMGAKAIVTRQGLQWGTVGGGKVEARAIALAMELLAQSREPKPLLEPLQLSWDLQRDIGMSCGGSVEVLFETYLGRPWSVLVFGAGHVGQALVRNLSLLDCHITCIDTRSEWLEKLPSHDFLTKVLTEDLASFAAEAPSESFCVLVTQGHASDVPVLRCLLRNPCLPYIGVIGSKVKARAIRAELLREGFDARAIQRFHCPMGIVMATHQPAEIAVSIVAQLLAIKNCRDKASMQAPYPSQNQFQET